MANLGEFLKAELPGELRVPLSILQSALERPVCLARMKRRLIEEEVCNTFTPATEFWTSTGA
jgi:hypothetical protein